MLQVPRRPLTVAHYRSVPEGGPRYQLINGDLIVAPAPNRLHQKVSRNLQYQISHYLEGNPIGELYDAPFDVQLSNIDVFQPDLVYVSRAHASILTAQGMNGAPDLVIEILSPSTAEHDLGAKREIYARTGVSELWIVDPVIRRLQRYLLQKDPERPSETYSEQAKVSTPLWPGLEIDLDRAFNTGL